MMNLQQQAVINDSQIIDHTPLKFLFADHVVLYYMKGLCCVLSGVCYITGRRRKRKGSVGPFRYHYYCEPTKDPALSQDPAFIFIIMLFSWPLNETRHLYETGGNSRQYGSKINNSLVSFGYFP